MCDASAKISNVSLNDCLEQGPSLLPDLFKVLIRFRWFKVTADIEKAFLNIQVKEEDRDVKRFLWFKDVENKNFEISKLRFTRVMFGMSCSVYMLNGTVHFHLGGY